jgi:hypothetical protein
MRKRICWGKKKIPIRLLIKKQKKASHLTGTGEKEKKQKRIKVKQIYLISKKAQTIAILHMSKRRDKEQYRKNLKPISNQLMQSFVSHQKNALLYQQNQQTTQPATTKHSTKKT